MKIQVMRNGRPATREELESAVNGTLKNEAEDMSDGIERYGIKIKLTEHTSVEGYKKLDGSGIGFRFRNGAAVTTVAFSRKAIRAIKEIDEHLHMEEDLEAKCATTKESESKQ